VRNRVVEREHRSLRFAGDQAQIHFDVILTNISSQSCALQGYPGVDLVGPDDQVWGPT
jgi:hypothetical protein